jgi:hypothetical protein
VETTIISLNSINQMIFVMDHCCRFFEVWAELLQMYYSDELRLQRAKGLGGGDTQSEEAG